MKNVKHLLVLLLFVNCTTDSSITDDRLEVTNVTLNELQTCVSDSPKVKLTNNGSQNFEFMVYAQDYDLLNSQNVLITSNSGWIELSENNVIVVASNGFIDDQKIPLNLDLCDNVELEIDANNTLIVSGD